MFLKITAFSLALLFTFSAQAKSNAQIRIGSYGLEAGSNELCDQMLTMHEPESDIVFIGPRYPFHLKDNVEKIKSDLDPLCIQNVQHKVEKRSTSLKLTSISEEKCIGKKSNIESSTVIFENDKIKLTQKVQDGAPYTCIWKKLK